VTAEGLRRELLGNGNNNTDNPWIAILDTILVQWKEVTGNYARIPDEAVEFLYESIQEYRRDGRAENSVYLSTVYAAKGLEFDHVSILGNWTRQRTVEKQEEERRPYYVGMTRARKTLTLYELAGINNPHTSELKGAAIERLEVGMLSSPSDDELRQCYSLLDLSSIWIDYPAIDSKSNNIRRQIAKLQTGSVVYLDKQQQNNRVFINNADGCKIGALSEAASRKWEDRLDSVRSVRIHSIITWRKEFSNRSSNDYPDEWEVPLLEVVWMK
jgi:ATP-dependent DNA helicase RecQ